MRMKMEWESIAGHPNYFRIDFLLLFVCGRASSDLLGELD